MSAPVVPSVGDSLPVHVVRDVKDAHIQQIALILRDPNPIHFDLEAVQAAGLGDRAVNQGGSTMAYVMTMLTGWAGGRGALRSISTRFRGTVVAGDDVICSGTVTSVRQLDGGAAEVACDVWADVDGGRRAIEGTALVVFG
jgi:acyl dehydratase